MRVCSPSQASSRHSLVKGLSLNEHRDNSTSTQTKTTMTEHTQQRRDFAGVAGHRDKKTVARGLAVAFFGVVEFVEDLVEHFLWAYGLGSAGFLGYAVPVLIVLNEAFLDSPFGEEVVDICLALSVVAGVDADPLAQ